MIRNYLMRNNIILPFVAFLIGSIFMILVAPEIGIPFGIFEVILLIIGAFIFGQFLDYYLFKNSGNIIESNISASQKYYNFSTTRNIHITNFKNLAIGTVTWKITEKPQDIRLKVLHQLKRFSFEIIESETSTLLRLYQTAPRLRNLRKEGDFIETTQKHAEEFEIALSRLVPGLKVEQCDNSAFGLLGVQLSDFITHELHEEDDILLTFESDLHQLQSLEDELKNAKTDEKIDDERQSTSYEGINDEIKEETPNQNLKAILS